MVSMVQLSLISTAVTCAQKSLKVYPVIQSSLSHPLILWYSGHTIPEVIIQRLCKIKVSMET